MSVVDLVEYSQKINKQMQELISKSDDILDFIDKMLEYPSKEVVLKLVRLHLG